MVTVETRSSQDDGVTFVEGWVENDGRHPRRVRVESRLDGPVLAPRRRGLPAPGWIEEGFETTLAPGERRGFGFATTADPVDPPVTVTDRRPADDADGIDPTPAGVVRALGESAPPRDAIGVSPVDPDATETASEADPAAGSRDDGTTDSDENASVSGVPAVTAWLAAVEHRIDCIEDRDGDGRESTADLDARARRLQAVANRAETLAERARSIASSRAGVSREGGLE